MTRNIDGARLPGAQRDSSESSNVDSKTVTTVEPRPAIAGEHAVTTVETWVLLRAS